MVRVSNAAILLAWCAASAAALARDAFEDLPRREVPGQQIGWYVNDTNAALVDAVEHEKLLVFVIGNEQSSFTQATARYVAPCPQLNQLAGLVVFAYGSPNVDEFARRIAVHLKLTDFPTTTFIAPRTDKLTELGRLEGFFDAQTIAQDARTAALQNNLWPREVSLKSLPQHRFAYPNMACTPQGAAAMLNR